MIYGDGYTITPRETSALEMAYDAYLADEIDIEQFERWADAALRGASELPEDLQPPAFPVVRNGSYVGPALQAYSPLPLERGH